MQARADYGQMPSDCTIYIWLNCKNFPGKLLLRYGICLKVFFFTSAKNTSVQVYCSKHSATVPDSRQQTRLDVVKTPVLMDDCSSWVVYFRRRIIHVYSLQYRRHLLLSYKKHPPNKSVT